MEIAFLVIAAIILLFCTIVSTIELFVPKFVVRVKQGDVTYYVFTKTKDLAVYQRQCFESLKNIQETEIRKFKLVQAIQLMKSLKHYEYSRYVLKDCIIYSKREQI